MDPKDILNAIEKNADTDVQYTEISQGLLVTAQKLEKRKHFIEAIEEYAEEDKGDWFYNDIQDFLKKAKTNHRAESATLNAIFTEQDYWGILETNGYKKPDFVNTKIGDALLQEIAIFASTRGMEWRRASTKREDETKPNIDEAMKLIKYIHIKFTDSCWDAFAGSRPEKEKSLSNPDMKIKTATRPRFECLAFEYVLWLGLDQYFYERAEALKNKLDRLTPRIDEIKHGLNATLDIVENWKQDPSTLVPSHPLGLRMTQDNLLKIIFYLHLLQQTKKPKSESDIGHLEMYMADQHNKSGYYFPAALSCLRLLAKTAYGAKEGTKKIEDLLTSLGMHVDVTRSIKDSKIRKLEDFLLPNPLDMIQKFETAELWLNSISASDRHRLKILGKD